VSSTVQQNRDTGRSQNVLQKNITPRCEFADTDCLFGKNCFSLSSAKKSTASFSGASKLITRVIIWKN
jgi:hypothetical protein